MSENRTHEATASKLARARAQGDAASSRELIAGVLLAWFVVWLNYFAAPLFRGLADLARASFAGRLAFEPALLASSFAAFSALLVGLPLLALSASALQRGFVFRGFGERARSASGERVSGLFVCTECAVLAWLTFTPVWQARAGVLDAWRRTAPALLEQLGLLARTLCTRAALTLLVIGLARLAYERYLRARRLRMTARELRDERRQTEGDPLMHDARRQRARRLYAQAALSELAQASFVIVGAGRALALRHTADENAPVLWIKAHDETAELLIAHARALGLPVLVDTALAQQLSALEPTEAAPASTHTALAALIVSLRRSATERPRQAGAA